mgnify:CR=1 FL=1
MLGVQKFGGGGDQHKQIEYNINFGKMGLGK